ncbi:MAG: ribose-5-phosphate isomerase [Chthoniobacterales bacterium]
MKISIGSDHAGFEYKQRIIDFLKKEGHEVTDVGTNTAESTDYPLYIIPAAELVRDGKCERGIVLGGSGNGEAMAANKVKGVRCALCWNDETAEFSRRHNNSNVLSIGQRMISFEIAIAILKIWLATPFDGGRHQNRIDEIDRYEAGKPLRE